MRTANPSSVARAELRQVFAKHSGSAKVKAILVLHFILTLQIVQAENKKQAISNANSPRTVAKQ